MNDSSIFEKFINADRANGWGNYYFDLTSKLVKKYNSKDILEIGVAYGAHAEKLITKDNIVSYTGIDPYRSAYDKNDPFTADIMKLTNIFDQRSFDILYAYTLFKLSKHKGTKLYRSSISECYHDLGKYDFIFIDGDHRYEAVLEDLHFSRKLIRPGGILVGDDISWPEVQKAWLLFSAIYDRTIQTIRNEGGYVLFFIEF